MRSLQKPRKLTIQGSDGNSYMFLGKPKDDLRKDARLMDFNSVINKLLRNNSESRKRRLRSFSSIMIPIRAHSSLGIRTYGIVTLNEECGFIQWVPNTVPLRILLETLYERRNLPIWVRYHLLFQTGAIKYLAGQRSGHDVCPNKGSGHENSSEDLSEGGSVPVRSSSI